MGDRDHGGLGSELVEHLGRTDLRDRFEVGPGHRDLADELRASDGDEQRDYAAVASPDQVSWTPYN